jgi:predicted outer membrane repeat protein
VIDGYASDFGTGKCIEVEGGTLAVGVPGANKVYIFGRSNGDDDDGSNSSQEWNKVPKQIITLPGTITTEKFGASVSIWGNRMVVGDSGSKKVYVFFRDTENDDWCSVMNAHRIADHINVPDFGAQVKMKNGTIVVSGDNKLFVFRPIVYDTITVASPLWSGTGGLLEALTASVPSGKERQIVLDFGAASATAVVVQDTGTDEYAPGRGIRMADGIPARLTVIGIPHLGQRPILSGGDATRIFFIYEDATGSGMGGELTLKHLELRNGIVSIGANPGGGAAIYAASGSRLWLFDLIFVDNVQSDPGTTNHYGGGAVSLGLENTALHGGADAVIKSCVFENNTAKFGGALFVSGTGSSAVITDSNFTGNLATASGGSFTIRGATSVLSCARCIVEGNSAKGSGNGVGGGLYAVSSIVSLVDSTFTKNEADRPNGQEGGAMYLHGPLQFSMAGSVLMEGRIDGESNPTRFVNLVDWETAALSVPGVTQSNVMRCEDRPKICVDVGFTVNTNCVDAATVGAATVGVKCLPSCGFSTQTSGTHAVPPLGCKLSQMITVNGAMNVSGVEG